MWNRLEVRLTRADVGKRVVIRWRPGPAGSKPVTDVLGILEQADAGSFTVRTRDGELVVIPAGHAVAGKVVPPPPGRRRHPSPGPPLPAPPPARPARLCRRIRVHGARGTERTCCCTGTDHGSPGRYADPGRRECQLGDAAQGICDTRGMQKISLDALAREHLKRARSAPSGRSAETVYGGHEHVLRQALMTLVKGRSLAEHENPGEATVVVLRGRVRVTAGADVWEAREGDLLIVPGARHNLEAVEDSAVLLTVAKAKEPAPA